MGPAVVIDKSAESSTNPDYLLTRDDIRAWEAEHGGLPRDGWLTSRLSAEKIPTPTEQSVFELFKIPYIEPWSRT